jgi:hypothetical protein
VVEAVGCIYQVHGSLVSVNTDRCHPFFGGVTAKKPFLPPQASVKQLVKGSEEVDLMTKNQERSTFSS